MDQQFYQQPGQGGGYPPQQGTGMQPPAGPYDPYGAQMQPPAGYQQPVYQDPSNPYVQPQPGYQQPGYQDPNDPYAQPGYQQPVYQDPSNPYAQPQQGSFQSPYGGVQQPYAEAGYQYHFDHGQQQAQPMQPAQEQAPTGFPAQPQVRAQKPQLRLTPFHIAVILAVLGFLGWYLYANFAPEAAKTGTITSGSLSANHTGDCLIVRNEVPYDAEGVTSVVYDAEEGASVIRDDQICKVYSSGYSTREMNALKASRTDIRNYQRNLIENETTYDAKLDAVTNAVVTHAKEVRNLIGGAQGSLANQEKMLALAVKDRQSYLKSKYASDQRFSRLYDDELSQSLRISSWTRQEVATGAGVVSFYSDGYEYSVNGRNYTSFEPRQVRSMINGNAPAKTTSQMGKTTIYRMVQDGEWYVLFLSKDTGWNPVNGQIYTLQLERFEATQVAAEVVNFTRSNGELLVRLKVNSSVKPVLYTRSCEAVLGENLTTLCVSERAIQMQDGTTGVTVVDGQTESFIPVNVIHYAQGNAYFQAIQQGFLFEGMTVKLY